MRRRMNLLSASSVRGLVRQAGDLHKAGAAALADALDGLDPVVRLVDADARMDHANASGHALMAAKPLCAASLKAGRERSPGRRRLLPRVLELRVLMTVVSIGRHGDGPTAKVGCSFAEPSSLSDSQ